MSLKVFQQDEPVKTRPVEDERTPTVFDGPGRGRKQCSSCQSYVGVRNLTCPVCGNKFNRAVKVARPSQERSEIIQSQTKQKKSRKGCYPSPHLTTVLIPAGACPVKLLSKEPEAVQAWAEKVRQVYLDRNEQIADEGLRYYAREFFDTFSDDYRQVAQLLGGDEDND